MYILYGSETGNAMELAELFADTLRYHNANPHLAPFGSISIEQLQTAGLCVVICSTTGLGHLPANTQPVWSQLLQRSLPKTTLEGLKFASFGLGDSKYQQFNWAIKKIHARFLQLGAQQIGDRGEGDEMASEPAEVAFDQWMSSILSLLIAENLIDVSSDQTKLLPPQYSLEICSDEAPIPTNAQSTGLERPGVWSAKVTKDDRLTAREHFQDVRHYQFELPKDEAHYEPSASAVIYPSNAPEHVDAILSAQGWTDICDLPIKVDSEWARQVPGGLVKHLTLRSLFLWHLDLYGVPKRSFFRLARHFADEREGERMTEFTTTDGLEDLFNYANRPRRSLIEAVLEFDSLKIPLDYILDLFPVLYPRKYSLASRENDPEAAICVAVVKYRTALRRIRRGVCTRYLGTLAVGDSVPLSLAPPLVPFTTDTRAAPLILVGAGTGIAPIRSVILSLSRERTQPVYLFFGCRFHDKDYLYDQEFSELAKQGFLHRFTAFSREGGGYVQQKITEHGHEISPILPKACIYVCGSAGDMPQAVRHAFLAVLTATRGLDMETAERVLAYKEKNGTYIEDTW